MRKQERRAWICLLLVTILLAGVGLFGYRFVKFGGEWATFYGNKGDSIVPPYLYVDGQHLTANGYEYITSKIEAWMKTL